MVAIRSKSLRPVEGRATALNMDNSAAAVPSVSKSEKQLIHPSVLLDAHNSRLQIEFLQHVEIGRSFEQSPVSRDNIDSPALILDGHPPRLQLIHFDETSHSRR